MWPFSKKSSELSPEIKQIFEKLHRFLRDDNEQIALYPKELRHQILTGLNVDKIPNATGSFGTTITNPIPVNGPIGEILYLSSLRFGEQRILFHRLRSFETIDVYECATQDGRHWDVLFMDMYHPRKSKLAPNEYSIVQNTLLSGINTSVSDFPIKLYRAIVDYSKQQFGMSLADPNIRLSLEKTSYHPPPYHTERVARIISGQLGVDRQEFIEKLVRETVSCQTKLYDTIAKFADIGLKKGDIHSVEIMYFALSLMTYSIFRWSQKHPKVEISDKASLKILRMNADSIISPPNFSDLVSQYQERSQSYRDALLHMDGSESWQHELGLILSRNILGKANPLIGLVLCATIPAIFIGMRETIEELELG